MTHEAFATVTLSLQHAWRLLMHMRMGMVVNMSPMRRRGLVGDRQPQEVGVRGEAIPATVDEYRIGHGDRP